MELNTDATVIAPPGGFVCADIPAVFQFDANGRVIQPAQIWSNEELNPQLSPTLLGTYYLVTFYDQNGARLNASPMWWQFPEVAGSTVDISQVIPISTVGGNVIFYPTAIGAVPSGSTNDVQINIGGVLYGDSGFTYDHTTGLVGIAGTLFVGPNDASFTVNPSTEGLDSTQVVNRIGINNQGTASGKNIGFAVLDEENFSGGSIGPYGTVLETLTTNAGTVTINASVFPSCIVGAAIDCTHVGAGNLAGTMNGPTGLLVSSSVFSNATVSNITGMVLDTGTSGTPTIGQITSLWISPGPDPGATVAKSIGIYIAPMVSASSVEWAIYADGAAASSFGGDLRLDKHIAATSILNQSAPSFIMNGTYWDGAASQDASFTITRTVGAGTNPGMQTNFINAGYGGGGSFVFNAAVFFVKCLYRPSTLLAMPTKRLRRAGATVTSSTFGPPSVNP